jgi:hypothetical protein
MITINSITVCRFATAHFQSNDPLHIAKQSSTVMSFNAKLGTPIPINYGKKGKFKTWVSLNDYKFTKNKIHLKEPLQVENPSHVIRNKSRYTLLRSQRGLAPQTLRFFH